MLFSVVLHDPRPSPLRLGTRVRDHDIAKLEANGVVLLPIDDHVARWHHALRDYSYRSFGVGEVSLSNDTPTRCSTLVLDHDPSLPYLHWIACIAATGPNPRAVVSITPDDGGGSLARATLSDCKPNRAVVEPGELAMPGDSVLVGGKGRLTASVGGGLVGLALLANGNDVCILWCAVSQCSEPRELGCLL